MVYNRTSNKNSCFLAVPIVQNLLIKYQDYEKGTDHRQTF